LESVKNESPVSSPDVAAPDGTQDDEQVNAPKKKTKSAKRGKKGNGTGKAKQRGKLHGRR
jgi:hypothetical protein